MEKRNKVNCKYQMFGCTWLFRSAELRTHIAECKFRPYRCIVDQLRVSPCNWTGLQHAIEDHLRQDHKELGKPFDYFQDATKVPFITSRNVSFVKLVNAFSKHFLFHYCSNVETQMVYFMIIYFGRRVDAHQYFYEFDIRSSFDQAVPRIKFIQLCVADCENIYELMKQESSCIAISFRTIQHYLCDSAIPFRFILKKDVVKRRTSESDNKQPSINSLSVEDRLHDNPPPGDSLSYPIF